MSLGQLYMRFAYCHGWPSGLSALISQSAAGATDLSQQPLKQIFCSECKACLGHIQCPRPPYPRVQSSLTIQCEQWLQVILQYDSQLSGMHMLLYIYRVCEISFHACKIIVHACMLGRYPYANIWGSTLEQI